MLLKIFGETRTTHTPHTQRLAWREYEVIEEYAEELQPPPPLYPHL